MTARSTPRTAKPAPRTPPVPTQHLAGRTWDIMERAGDDIVVPKQTILLEVHVTESQFTRLKGYIRDRITMEKGKAFLAFGGGYIITTDPMKIAASVGKRLAGINTELRRLLSGWINPLGENVGDYEVLAMYQDEIGHMLRLEDRMRKASIALPAPAKPPTRKRARATPKR
ncbi:hypothetical protein ACPA54_12915 [Uniformispora flossi]|uniref:hypothetical protein n=1 Tax=Uniformispora flossi TaxID=3390723 RepID=UPI003C30EA6F